MRAMLIVRTILEDIRKGSANPKRLTFCKGGSCYRCDSLEDSYIFLVADTGSTKGVKYRVEVSSRCKGRPRKK